MMFDSVEAALHMQGHGFYVWMAYAVTWITIGGLIILPLRRKSALLKGIAQRARIEDQQKVKNKATDKPKQPR
ncbi:Uncharacterised protein [BD1-7 clade bacterium]|uniref:Heme exporter protein D n=1 Tax=BD1-7 clade bacterium TaxID=2029982 RepID=A0A5S9NKF6_9GAMM|nr:Uncharacterised protein [BD1-7 clade bacterium]CAA0093653.1 Uncharacterised protein [BD1-7 clade bacterium]